MYASTIVNKNSRVQLTSAGKDLHDSMRLDGTDRGEILVFLNDNGASRVFTMADYLNMDDKRAVLLTDKLVRNGYIEEVGDQVENESEEM